MGRDYQDVTDTIHTSIRSNVIIRTVINALTFDGATREPMQQAVKDALIGFMAATALHTGPRIPRGAERRYRGCK